MYSLNGIGTKLYGKSDVDSDGSYVATKWFIFFLLPIIPLGSYRVWRGDTKSTLVLPGVKTEYKILKVDMNWKQIIYTFSMIWGITVIAVSLLFYFSEF